MSAGVEGANGWAANLAGRYASAMCIDYSCDRSGVDNTFRETDSLFVLDLAASYPLADSVRIYARVENLLDEEAIVSRSPAGARPNKPRSFIAGLTVQF